MFQEIIEGLPIYGVFILFALVALLVYEIGYMLGRWYQNRTPEEKEGPTGMIVGSIVALMAFLLAITMGMATDRFDTRRGLVLEEANAIGTTYLRAGYLPEPASTDSRELLRTYVPLRIAPDNVEDGAAQVAASREILAELWLIAEELARAEADSEMLGLYIETLNETIDIENMRANAGLFVRVPETVLLLLVVGSWLALGMVGFSAGLTKRRSMLTALVMVIVLGAVITLIIDIDRPQGGTLTVSQGPLIEVAEQIGPPST